MPSLSKSKQSDPQWSGHASPEEQRNTLADGLDEGSFNSWTELEDFLVERCGFESVAICLLPDFIGSETVDCLGRLSTFEMGGESVLLEVAIGYRVRLAVHLVNARGKPKPPESWPPGFSYSAIASCARAVFTRSVSDRVVELIADRKGDVVAWFYLNREGEIETASEGAEAFCARHCPKFGSCEECFPDPFASYTNELLKKLQTEPDRLAGSGFAYAIHCGDQIVHCLLRPMAGSGFLLSLSLDS